MSSDLTFVFTGNIPENIQLGRVYDGPKNPKMAEYNSGKGWKPCLEERNIYGRIALPIHSNQISFRGDWRDEEGAYEGLFYYTFSRERGIKDAIVSGTLEHDANNTPRGYASLFCGCDGIVYMRDNPLPKLKGILTQSMLLHTFREMETLTSLPEGFMDMSEMHEEPGDNSLYHTCYNMGISSPHIFKLGSNIKLSRSNIPHIFFLTWCGMKNWTGTVLWGDKVLFNKAVPDKRVGAVCECYNMIGYDKIHENWK